MDPREAHTASLVVLKLPTVPWTTFNDACHFWFLLPDTAFAMPKIARTDQNKDQNWPWNHWSAHSDRCQDFAPPHNKWGRRAHVASPWCRQLKTAAGGLRKKNMRMQVHVLKNGKSGAKPETVSQARKRDILLLQPCIPRLPYTEFFCAWIIGICSEPEWQTKQNLCRLQTTSNEAAAKQPLSKYELHQCYHVKRICKTRKPKIRAEPQVPNSQQFATRVHILTVDDPEHERNITSLIIQEILNKTFWTCRPLGLKT